MSIAFPGVAIPGNTVPGFLSTGTLPKIFVIGDFKDFITQAPTGDRIQVTPSIRNIVDQDNDTVYVVHAFTIPLVGGIIHTDQNPDTMAWGIYLPATTYPDPGISPSGWHYSFNEPFSGRQYQVQLPYDLAGGVFDLTDATTT